MSCSVPPSSRYVAPSGLEKRVPSLKMLPTSIAGSIVIGWPSTVSPASTERTSARSKAKSRPGSTPRRWWSVSLAPTT